METKCACGCGQPVVKTAKTGRSKTYATPACRKRALRIRKQRDALVPLPDVIRNAPVTISGATIEQQVQRAIVEAKSIGFAFQRLGRTARPELAARCARVGEVLIESIKSNFGEGI